MRMERKRGCCEDFRDDRVSLGCYLRTSSRSNITLPVRERPQVGRLHVVLKISWDNI
jgi:hypothetical protein